MGDKKGLDLSQMMLPAEEDAIPQPHRQLSQKLPHARSAHVRVLPHRQN
jgi:hypothetical protein